MAKLRKTAAAFAVATIAAATATAALGAAPAQAKTVTAAKTLKKAKKVKTGTTTVKLPANESFGKGYVKFTAPKKGTYVFQFWDLQKSPRDAKAIECGYVNVSALRYARATSPTVMKVSTQGGKSYALQICTNAFRQVDLRRGRTSVTASTYLTKRSCALKMKKGQSVWAYFSFTGGKSTVKVKIKKK